MGQARRRSLPQQTAGKREFICRLREAPTRRCWLAGKLVFIWARCDEPLSHHQRGEHGQDGGDGHTAPTLVLLAPCQLQGAG